MAIGPPAVFTPIPTLNGRPAFGLGNQTVVSTTMPQNSVAYVLNNTTQGVTQTYTGYAIPGASQANPAWYIKSVKTLTATSNVTVTTWAQGTANSTLVLNSGISKAITGITKANPAVVSVSSTANLPAYVYIFGVGGMTQVNSGQYAVTIINATTFSIGVNSSAYTDYTSGGTAYFPEFLGYTYS